MYDVWASASPVYVYKYIYILHLFESFEKHNLLAEHIKKCY